MDCITFPELRERNGAAGEPVGAPAGGTARRPAKRSTAFFVIGCGKCDETSLTHDANLRAAARRAFERADCVVVMAVHGGHAMLALARGDIEVLASQAVRGVTSL